MSFEISQNCVICGLYGPVTVKCLDCQMCVCEPCTALYCDAHFRVVCCYYMRNFISAQQANPNGT